MSKFTTSLKTTAVLGAALLANAARAQQAPQAGAPGTITIWSGGTATSVPVTAPAPAAAPAPSQLPPMQPTGATGSTASASATASATATAAAPAPQPAAAAAPSAVAGVTSAFPCGAVVEMQAPPGNTSRVTTWNGNNGQAVTNGVVRTRVENCAVGDPAADAAAKAKAAAAHRRAVAQANARRAAAAAAAKAKADADATAVKAKDDSIDARFKKIEGQIGDLADQQKNTVERLGNVEWDVNGLKYQFQNVDGRIKAANDAAHLNDPATAEETRGFLAKRWNAESKDGNKWKLVFEGIGGAPLAFWKTPFTAMGFVVTANVNVTHTGDAKEHEKTVGPFGDALRSDFSESQIKSARGEYLNFLKKYADKSHKSGISKDVQVEMANELKDMEARPESGPLFERFAAYSANAMDPVGYRTLHRDLVKARELKEQQANQSQGPDASVKKSGEVIKFLGKETDGSMISMGRTVKSKFDPSMGVGSGLVIKMGPQLALAV